ncbi:glycosyl transferase [Scenedesmus sp. NREL 46B-D3]|nr:glycosyl transferase [Scenedesmus sp. NREL 46B-D3]
MPGNQLPVQRACSNRLNILMVSDFFYPNFGGVENHIYQLSQCLINQGHKVVVMTHAYGECGGVRYLTNGLKVYYLYRRPIHAQSTMPTLWLGAFRLLRLICIRERISLVHCHQAFSTLGGEALVQARTMGYKVVFTDHSLFGFADAASIATNKLIKAVLADVQHVICVSHTSKENTVLRASLHPAAVSVVPNAVDASEFEPYPNQPRRAPGSPITIVALSRLVYRKGIDILALVIPEICHRHPHVSFIIGGDGPKRGLLEQMVAQEGLAGRVKLAGAIPHERAREFLLQGDIFVNASLTEAFCMAIVEAASAGLLVVSTRVGGVPEVLPPDVMLLAEPSPEELLAAVEAALLRLPSLDPQRQHERVRAMYNWPNVAQRTEAVYRAALAAPAEQDALLPRLRRYRSIGSWAGLLFCCVVVLLHWFWWLLEWQQPAQCAMPCSA